MFGRKLFAVLILVISYASQAAVVEIIDATGDGGTNTMDAPNGIAVDSAGNAYVANVNSGNVFRISSAGVVTEILDAVGDGTNALDRPNGVAVDSSGNVYVTGQFSDNVFRIATPDTCTTDSTPCTITEIMDSTGDGASTVDTPIGIATDSTGNVFVGDSNSGLYRIATPGTCSTVGSACTITKIIDATIGDGSVGNTLSGANSVTVDPFDNVYVVGQNSDNVLRVAAPITTCSSAGTPCTITEIIDSTGDGTNIFDFGRFIDSDSLGNLYVNGFFPVSAGSVFKIDVPGSCSTGGTPCVITELLGGVNGPIGIAVDDNDNVYVAVTNTDTVTKIDTPTSCSTSGTACTTSTVMDATGDGSGNTLDLPNVLTVGAGALYVSGTGTDNAFKLDLPSITITIAAASVSETAGAAATTATVTRNTDTTGALTVNLSSNDTSEATVPASVTILAGQVSANFNIDAVDDALVDGTQTVTITASATAHSSGTDTLDVTDNEVASLAVSIVAASVSETAGAAATTATVTRNTDTTGALAVNLSSNDTSEATVPASVTILAGQASASFDIDTVDDAIADGTQTITITASAAAHTNGTDTLGITDNEVASLSVSIVAASVSEIAGAAATTATVTRNTPTTGPLTVNLSSNDIGEATVPASVTILAGQPSASFDINAVDDAIADGTQTVTVTASAAGHTNGTDTLGITDNEVASLTVSIVAASVSETAGAAATSATVTRNTPTTGPLTVNLSSNDTGEATVPASVTILAGQASASFNINAVDDAVVDGSQTVTVTASAAAHNNGTDTVDVTDDEVASLSVSIVAASVSETAGAAATTATVTRNTDTTGALSVNLSSNDTGEATVPASVTILAGQTSANFDIGAVDDAIADGTQTVTVTASAAAHTNGTDTVEVTDNEVASLTLVIAAASISEIDGAAATTATVTRNTDTTGALTVNLSSDDTSEATVPASVTILAGQPSATFNIDAVDDALLDSTQTVTLTASATAHTGDTDTIDVTSDDTSPSYTGTTQPDSGPGLTATATVSGGGASCLFHQAQFVPLSAVPSSPPGSLVLPHGLFDFTLDGCTPGATAAVTIDYGVNIEVSNEYWKYGATANGPDQLPATGDDGQPSWYSIPATVTATAITFSVTDGGLGDDDLAANGTIKDPGGPSSRDLATATPVPAFNLWALLLLSSLLGWIAVRRSR